MTDERISRLEDGLTQALVQNARLAAAVEHLSESVLGLQRTVGDLRDTMNKGRGALWVVVAASSVMGAVMATLISNAFGKAS
jgi:hypothetical protein